MGRKARKKKAGQGVGRLLNLARRRIAAGDGKKALDLLKRARYGGASQDEMGPLLYRAHMLRAKALSDLELARQAQASRNLASKFRVAPDEHQPAPSTLLTLMKGLPDNERFALYAKYLRANQPHSEAELDLADRLVLRRCWEHLEVLSPSSQFRLDADLFASALPQFDRGDRSGGCRLLRRIGWESAFREWKTFGVAMAAYERGDSNLATATLKKLGPGFPLRKSRKALAIAIGRRSQIPRSISLRFAELFRLNQARIASCVRDLRAALGFGNGERMAQAVRTLGTAAPPSTRGLRLHIALGSEHAAWKGEISCFDFLPVLAFLAAPDQMPQRLERGYVRMLARRDAGLLSPEHIERYLDRLPEEFPGKEHRRLARSRILFRLGRAIRFNTVDILDDKDLDAIERLAGLPVDRAFDTRVVVEALYRASLSVDPSYTDGHKELVDLLRSAAYTKRSEIVAACEAYAEAQPDDPEPWIALAEFRLSHSAYRKAEAALKQARKHGGDDDRVIEMLVATYLFAAHQNLGNGRLGAAELDIQNAEAVTRPATQGLVTAWRVMLTIAWQERPNWRSACCEQVDPHSPVVRVRAPCLA